MPPKEAQPLIRTRDNAAKLKVSLPSQHAPVSQCHGVDALSAFSSFLRRPFQNGRGFGVVPVSPVVSDATAFHGRARALILRNVPPPEWPPPARMVEEMQIPIPRDALDD